MPLESGSIYEFGLFRLEPAERRLHRDGRPVLLPPKAFDTLCVLVERGGHAVSKSDLMAKVWPDTIVEEATLAQNIFAVRKALGGNQCIETVPKFGYRLVMPVRELRAPTIEPRHEATQTDTPSHWLKWGSRRIRLTEGHNIVGRDPDVEVTLDAPTVSRRHARITLAGARAVLEDLGSKNGTFLAGERLTASVRLSDGDLVGFGSLSLSFHARLPLMSTQTQSSDGSTRR